MDENMEHETLSMKQDGWRQEVEAVLDEVRPALASHGGDAEVRSIDGRSVTTGLKGSCHGCPMSVMTFGLMVDDMIKRRLPEAEVYYE